MAGIFTQTCLKGSKDSPAKARSLAIEESWKIWAESWAKSLSWTTNSTVMLGCWAMGMILRPFHCEREREVNGTPHIWSCHGNRNESRRYDVPRCYQCWCVDGHAHEQKGAPVNLRFGFSFCIKNLINTIQCCDGTCLIRIPIMWEIQ